MSQFSSSGKQYPSGDPMDGFGLTNVNVTTSGTTLEQMAAPSLPGPDGKPLSFYFWDTGRRITNKRKVRWTFNHPENWSDWRAIAWYGPSGGKSVPQANTSAYWVGVSAMAPTPIDGAASTFVNGPGGTPLAWPYSGDDHVMRTEWGAATVHAKAHLQASSGSPQVDFSSWIQMVAGGDATGYFSETDDDIESTSSGSGVSGIVGSGSADFSVAMGAGAILVAGYVIPPLPDDHGLLGRLREVIAGGMLGKYIDMGDPSPEDIIRLKLISESLDLVRGERPTSTDAFEALMDAARGMSAQELKRTIVSTQTTLRRGQAAVKYLESVAAKQRTLATKAVATKKAAATKAAPKTRKPAK